MNGGGTWYINFSGPGIVTTGGAPMCACGKGIANVRLTFPNGVQKMVCPPCAEIAKIDGAIANASAWLEAAFTAVGPERRALLYKALARAFHPDTGGDPRLMVALNAVRARFP